MNTDNHQHSVREYPHDPSIHSNLQPQSRHNHSHTHTNTKAVVNRLARAIGHLGSVKTMVENGRDCSEVLIQLSAVRAAINGVCDLILKDHIDHCIVDAVKTGDMESIAELNRAIMLLIK